MTNTLNITVTEPAIEHVSQIAERNGHAFFRLHVRTAGCSGYKYHPETVVDTCDTDVIITMPCGWRMLVSAEAAPMVVGTTIDYVKKGIGHQLVFRNPLAENECGCGESFALVSSEKKDANNGE